MSIFDWGETMYDMKIINQLKRQIIEGRWRRKQSLDSVHNENFFARKRKKERENE